MKKDDKNNNPKKPQEGKDYKVVKGEDGKTPVSNLNHPDNVRINKQKLDEVDPNELLDMIKNPKYQKKKEMDNIVKRLKAEKAKKTADSVKLREFLQNLPDDTCEEDYTDTPLYGLGYEDGWDAGETAGHEIASQRFQDELRALRTIIEAFIDSK